MKNNIVKLNENTLRQIVAENVKKVLKEYAEGNEMSAIPGENYAPSPKSLIQTIINEGKHIDGLLGSLHEAIVKNDYRKARKWLTEIGYGIDVVLDRANDLQGLIDYYFDNDNDDEI